MKPKPMREESYVMNTYSKSNTGMRYFSIVGSIISYKDQSHVCTLFVGYLD